MIMHPFHPQVVSLIIKEHHKFSKGWQGRTANMKRTLTGPWELNTLDEAELITRTQNGDTEAFTPIVHRYRERIYKLIYRWVRHHETAEDLCQEVFLKAWQVLPRFKGGALIYSWLHRIAVNCSKDFIRKQNRQGVFEDVALPHNADDRLQMAQTHSNPHEILETEELRSIISKCVRRLPSNQCYIFCLYYRDGLSIKEIASRLNKAEGTIKTHLRRARQELQHKLRPYLRNESFQGRKEI